MTKAKSDLILIICPSELKQIKNCVISKDIWEKLHNVYQSKGPARKAMLLKTLILMKIKNGENHDERPHTKLLLRRRQNPRDGTGNYRRFTHHSVVIQHPKRIRIAIKTQEKLPEPEVLKIKLLEEYEARKRNTKESVPGAMFISKNSGRLNQNKKTENLKREKFKFACHTCGKIGHKSRDCKSKLFNNNKPKEQEQKRTKSTRNAEVVIKVNTEYEERWCLDSGAFSHMCSEKTKFEGVTTKKTLNLANNDSTEIMRTGTVKLKTKKGLVAKLEETLYVLNLRSNLLSVAKIAEHGLEVTFRKNEAIVKNPKTDKKLIIAHQNGNLYYVDKSTEEGRVAQKSTSSFQEWHELWTPERKGLKECYKSGKDRRNKSRRRLTCVRSMY